MRAAKTAAFLASAAILALPAVGFSQKKDPAAEYLLRSWQRKFSENVITIINQRTPGPGESYMRVKIEKSKTGQERQTILQPLRFQGFTKVDDLDRLRTYIPDRRQILDEVSPSREPNEAESRMKLARQNYTFRLVDGGKIAGRSAVCVVATPKNEELEVRKFYLDEATAYPLRTETYSTGNEVNVIFDTKDIQFPKSMAKGLFTLAAIGDVQVVKYERPKSIINAAQARSLVGFTPLIPQGLPMGFKVQEIQYHNSKDQKAIVVRISDGLARATIYQSRPSDRQDSFEDSTVVEHGGIRLMLISDLGSKVRAQLLRAFISHATNDSANRAQRYFSVTMFDEAGLRTCSELAATLMAFAGLDRLGMAYRDRLSYFAG